MSKVSEVSKVSRVNELKSDYRNLEIYKKAKKFRKEIFELIKLFPKEEKFLLKTQLIRASRSIGANIAEGYGRYHYRENIQFCRQARGSLYECLDHINVAYECCYIDDEQLLKYE